MFLSRIELRPVPSDDPAHAQAFWGQATDAYNIHKAIWTWFGDHADRQRDFLYRVDHHNPGSPLRVYVLSARSPSVDGRLWRLDVRAFEPGLRPGDRLSFVLRANATVQRNGKRHDVVMDARQQLAPEQRAEVSRDALAQDAGQAWLSARAARWGVAFERAVVDRYSVQAFRKHRKARPIQLGVLDLSGLLTVQDPEAFVAALGNGFGRAKGFGCGMMMIRRC